jgi:hypothetical protein
LSHRSQRLTLRRNIRLPLEGLGKLLGDQCEEDANHDYGDVRKEAAPSIWRLDQWQVHITPAPTLGFSKAIWNEKVGRQT